jgi:hypothetical protein
MFVRTIKNAKGTQYLQIVRSYRKDGKVRQEVLFSLGRLDRLQSTGQLDSLVRSLSRFCLKTSLIDLTKDLSIDKVYYLGAVHFVRRLWEKTGLSKAFANMTTSIARRAIPVADLTLAMIAGRFLTPSSKRRLGLEIWEKVYPDLLPVTELPLHWLYRTMDDIYSRREMIERTLFDRQGQRDLFNQELDLVFYDTTTLYFESTDDKRGNLRRFGYSKEHRVDCTQVVLGLLVDRDGIPVGFELFNGSTYDSRTLPAVLNKLKNKYRIKRIIFVADRGMLSNENLNLIQGSGFEFIIGMRLWKMPREEHEAFYNLRAYRWMDGKKTLAIRQMSHPKGRLILTWSLSRAERDAAIREELLETIKKKLTASSDIKRFVTNRGYRQFLKGFEEGRPSLDEQAVKAAKKKDGFFGVLTNIPADRMSAQEVYANYKNLWRIEDAFGEIKGPLQTRPMFHWTDKRIHAHVLICLLAYYLEAVVAKALREKSCAFSAPALFRSLNEVYAIPVDVRGIRAWVRNEIQGIAFEGYQALGIKPPERILKIVKGGVVVQTDMQKNVTDSIQGCCRN